MILLPLYLFVRHSSPKTQKTIDTIARDDESHESHDKKSERMRL